MRTTTAYLECTCCFSKKEHLQVRNISVHAEHTIGSYQFPGYVTMLVQQLMQVVIVFVTEDMRLNTSNPRQSAAVYERSVIQFVREKCGRAVSGKCTDSCNVG